MDQYCLLVLMRLYFPIINSLQGLQQASQLKKIQRNLNRSPTSLGSLSESVAIFDPKPLKQIVRKLADRLPEASTPRTLPETAYAARVLNDQLVRLPQVDHLVRLVCMRCSAHTSSGRRRGRKFSSTDGILRVITEMLELPAELIAEIYQFR